MPTQEGKNMNQPDPPPSGRDRGWLTQWIKNLRLAWRLVRDPQVPLWTRLIPLAALAYIVLPFDFIPDWMLGPGQVDDVGLFLLGLKLLIDTAPSQAVQRHLSQMTSIEGTYRVVDEERQQDTSVAGYIDAESPEVPETFADTESRDEEQ
jgi:uncharacterized membrane protein YkvA (DUF1232 family)